MMEPAYPIARVVAPKVRQHIVEHICAAREEGETDLAPDPDEEAIEAIIDAAFWASLRREEGVSPTISLAYLPPSREGQLTFEHSLPLAPEPLTRLAPAVERPNIHLGVWRSDAAGSRAGGELRVWGAIRALPAYCFVLEVVAPGLLVVKHSRAEESRKFVNIAVLEGDQMKVLDPRAASRPGAPSLLASLFGLDLPSSNGDTGPLVQLALSMREHGQGGTLLVVPDGGTRWRESVVQPIPYAIAPPFSRLADALERLAGGDGDRIWQDAVHSAVEGVAGLTAVDITDRYHLVAFGATIARRDGAEQVERVLLTEPVEGDEPSLVLPPQLGGTRHLSAAQFASDQRDAIAMVASTDGRFTVFAWSGEHGVVQAHRVDALLL